MRERENRIIAQAVNWDLNTIVELFKIPDVKLNGIVSGDIPVVFSTGSARIEKAELAASQTGGVIQYTGSTGDAAAQADPNAKMLFDALKDFRYKVLKVGLNGDIAGQITLTMNLFGKQPDGAVGSAVRAEHLGRKPADEPPEHDGMAGPVEIECESGAPDPD